MRALVSLLVCVLACDRTAGRPSIEQEGSEAAAAAVPSSAEAKTSLGPSLSPGVSPPVEARVADSGPTLSMREHSTDAICGAVGGGGEFMPNFVNVTDLRRSYLDARDLLAQANRSPLGAMGPGEGPPDLVDFLSGKPKTQRECETSVGSCLRKEAAEGLRSLLSAMAKAGFVGHVESAYRGYMAQCGTFVHWAKKEESSFCQATEQSALPGHSQHQLGTAVDLFTEHWKKEGKEKGESVFRSGFGCTSAGLFLEAHAWEHGFVHPYPIHPDDRRGCGPRGDMFVPPNPATGYRHEPWHLRFIGGEAAKAFHEAREASGVGKPSELSLEDWLRRRAGREGSVELPVCDGCNCGACASLASQGGPCKERRLTYGEDGHVVLPAERPTLLAAVLEMGFVRVRLKVPAGTPTQPPVVTRHAPAFSEKQTFESWTPYSRTEPHAYPDLKRAYRIGLRWSTLEGIPIRASLAEPELSRSHNRVNGLLPGAPGERAVEIPVRFERGAPTHAVLLYEGGVAHEIAVTSRADGGG